MKNIRLWIFGIAALAVGLVGFIVPERILAARIADEVGTVHQVAEIYENTNLSSKQENMNYEDKISLVASRESCDQRYLDEDTPGILDREAIVELVKSRLQFLAAYGLIPLDITSGYQNWYTYGMELVEYTDTYFGNYSCTIWEVQVTHYEGNYGYSVLVDAKTGEFYRIALEGTGDFSEENKSAREHLWDLSEYVYMDVDTAFSYAFFASYSSVLNVQKQLAEYYGYSGTGLAVENEWNPGDNIISSEMENWSEQETGRASQEIEQDFLELGIDWEDMFLLQLMDEEQDVWSVRNAVRDEEFYLKIRYSRSEFIMEADVDRN